MRAFIMGHKKLCVVILAALLVLSFWLFKPKLSSLSDTGLKVFLWFNGIEPPQDAGWSQEGLASIREFIKKVEEYPDYMPVYNWTKMLVLHAKINKAVNRYYGRPFVHQSILDWEKESG